MPLFSESSAIALSILFDTKNRIIDYSIKFHQNLINEEQLKTFISMEMKMLKSSSLKIEHPETYQEVQNLAKQLIQNAERPRLP